LEFNFPFQHKYSYIRDERFRLQTSTLVAFLFSSNPKRERDQRGEISSVGEVMTGEASVLQLKRLNHFCKLYGNVYFLVLA